MVRSQSSIGTILAIIGILVLSFVLLWTGNESVVIILAAGYFFLWGYYDICFTMTKN